MTCWICVSLIMGPPVEGRGEELRSAARSGGAPSCRRSARGTRCLRRKHAVSRSWRGAGGPRPGPVGVQRAERDDGGRGTGADDAETPTAVADDGAAYTRAGGAGPPGGRERVVDG